MHDLKSLRETQRLVDEISFFASGKRYSHLSAYEILRHDLFHIVKLAAKAARFCDDVEHGLEPSHGEITDEVIPDLLVYALQLSNAFHVDIEDKYRERLGHIVRKNEGMEKPSDETRNSMDCDVGSRDRQNC